MIRHLMWSALVMTLLAVPVWVLGQPAGNELSKQGGSRKPRHVAYKLLLEAQEVQRKAREQVAPGKK